MEPGGRREMDQYKLTVETNARIYSIWAVQSSAVIKANSKIKLYSFIQASINQCCLNGKNSMAIVHLLECDSLVGTHWKTAIRNRRSALQYLEDLCATLRPQTIMNSYVPTVNWMKGRSFLMRTHEATTVLNQEYRQGRVSQQKQSRDISLPVLVYCWWLYVNCIPLVKCLALVGWGDKMLLLLTELASCSL